MQPLRIGLLFFVSAFALSQNDEAARRVYVSSQDSVFLVYLNDSSGTPTALGSAFLVAPRTLITNAHVVDAGNPVLAVGPVRIPVRVARKDEKNDLAVLSVDIDLTSKLLSFAEGMVSPGQEIFAIGNPEGLEKTISQGIVSGIRKDGGRDLIQITSPISHGSSGGPILNTKGEVIGVAVGILGAGQNLNFAVPAGYAKALLEQKPDNTVLAADVSQTLNETKALVQKTNAEDYSSETSSSYQQDTSRLLTLVQQLSAMSTRTDVLNELACIATSRYDLSDYGIKAARTLARDNPSPENRALLSYVLLSRAQNEDLRYDFASDNTPEKASAKLARDQFLAEAEREATAATSPKGNRPLVADFVAGSIKGQREQTADAIGPLTRVANGKATICGDDLAEQAYRKLIADTNKMGLTIESERWFRRYASLYEPPAYQWDLEGDRRASVNDNEGSADAYEHAANGSPDYSYDYCYAATGRYFQTKTDGDAVLSDGRKCVDASVKATEKESQRQFSNELPIVYRLMAEILKERGAYQQALEYVKESLAAKPNEPFTLDVEAAIFARLERYTECISAEQAAINGSDGKYPSMQFQLGYCYFSTENWSKAASSFRIAAEADKTDAVAAFNLGLSLSRQGFGADADLWYREALKRNPDSETRSKILNSLK